MPVLLRDEPSCDQYRSGTRSRSGRKLIQERIAPRAELRISL